MVILESMIADHSVDSSCSLNKKEVTQNLGVTPIAPKSICEYVDRARPGLMTVFCRHANPNRIVAYILKLDRS